MFKRLTLIVASLTLISAMAATPVGARKRHVSVRFLVWGVRTLGQSHGQYAYGKKFVHCQSTPVVHLVANFREHGQIKPRARVTGKWSLNGQAYGSYSFRWGRSPGNQIFFGYGKATSSTSAQPLPDGAWKIRVLINGKAYAHRSLRLAAKAC
jgi:hypothetical protein